MTAPRRKFVILENVKLVKLKNAKDQLREVLKESAEVCVILNKEFSAAKMNFVRMGFALSIL